MGMSRNAYNNIGKNFLNLHKSIGIFDTNQVVFIDYEVSQLIIRYFRLLYKVLCNIYHKYYSIII